MPSYSILLNLLAVGSLGLGNVYGAPLESDTGTSGGFTVIGDPTTNAPASGTTASLPVTEPFNVSLTGKPGPLDEISKYTVQVSLLSHVLVPG